MVKFPTLALHFTIMSARSIVLEERARSPEPLAAASYLAKYGYIKENTSGERGSLISIQNAVREFQEFAGLPETGDLDEETLRLMQTPRCGVKDIVDEDITGDPVPGVGIVRTRRYALQGSRWRVKDLTYRISKYPTSGKLTKLDVDQTMRKSFDVWEKVTDLKFEETKDGKVHIDISFERRFHGDDDAFDGEGGTLAHAYFPGAARFAGDAHFDEEEDWTVDSPRGTSLLLSAAHELGHSLGLSHSSQRGAIMAPFYRGYEKDISLAKDDIEAIEALYGEKVTPIKTKPDPSTTSTTERTDVIVGRPRPNEPRPTSPPAPVVNNRELCNGGGKMDTMVSLKNETTYVFKGNDYWKLTETSVEPGYPRSISRDWGGLPGDLDAAFTWTNGKTYFFKGSQYWRFTDGVKDSDYPKSMSSGFGGIPSNVDTAFLWPANDKIYFFKGSEYWKFDAEVSPPVAESYPRPISHWDGIPSNIDAALQYSNGKLYFFKNGKYYRWDNDKFNVDKSANPAFPRDTGYWWFGCKNNSPLKHGYDN